MRDISRRLLPPVGALQCFEAAARTESFSRAGDDVGLTQSAVSRQIAMLEGWLDRRLFDRTGRRVRLTAEGREYLDAVTPALARLRRATAALLDKGDANALTIATLPSFGMRWLAPRLPRFSALYPSVTVNFIARSDPFDLAATGYDGAIHYGLPDWRGATHTLLFRETSSPVIAPALLRDRNITAPRDLLTVPLLLQQSRRDAWKRWFDIAGVDMTRSIRGATYDQFLMLAQAVAAGAGAALIPTFLIEPELASGALMQTFDFALTGEEAYYFVHPDHSQSKQLEAFVSWIAHEGGEPARTRSSD